MAVVPTDEIGTVQQEPLPGRAIPRFSDEASPAAFGAGLGQGIEQAASDVRQAQDKADQLAVIKANTQLKAAKDQILFDPKDGAYTKEGENAINLSGQYQPQFDKAISDIGSNLANPKQQRAFQSFASQEQDDFTMGLNRHEYAQGKAAEETIYKTAMEQSVQSGSNNFRDPVAVQRERDTQSLLAHQYAKAKGLPDSVGDMLATDANEKMNRNVGMGLVQMDPAGSLKSLTDPDSKDPNFAGITGPVREELINRAKVGTAKKMSDGILGTYQQFGPKALVDGYKQLDKSDVPDDVKDQARSDIQRGVQQWQGEQRQKYSDQIITLERHLADPTKLTDADVSSAWDLIHKGAYTPVEGGNILGRIDAGRLKAAPDTALLDWGNEVYNSRRAVDPDNAETKKAIDAVFQDRTQNVAKDSPEFTNRGIDILKATGVVPPSLVSYYRAQFDGGEPKSAANAALGIRAITAANPRGSLYGIDDKLKAGIKVVADAVESGQDPVAAVEMQRKNDQLPETERKRLDETWKKLPKSETGWTGADTRALGDVDKRFATPFYSFRAALQPPPDMQGAFERQLREHYIGTNGNIVQARQLALDDVRNKWNVSDVNGKREIMAWAPEPMNNLSTKQIRDDMEESIAGMTPDPKKAKLTPAIGGDATTENSKGQVWNITVPDEHGLPKVLQDKNGRALEYHLPSSAAAYTKELNERQANAYRDMVNKNGARAQKSKEDFKELYGEMAPDIMGNMP